MSARERRAAERDRSRSSISRTRDDGLDSGGGGRDDDDDDGGSSRDRDDDDDRAAGGFGRELGGDPAGDSDRDTRDDTRDRDDDDGGRSRDRDDDDDRAAGGFGRELGGDPAGADQAEQDVMDETARADQEASQRVGGSGDPTESDTRVDPFLEDTQASQRVGGSGDPFDEPVDPVDTDASRADQQASRQLGGSGDPTEGPSREQQLSEALEAGAGVTATAGAGRGPRFEDEFGGELVNVDEAVTERSRAADERFAFEQGTPQRRVVEGLGQLGEAVSEQITPERLQASPTTAREVGVGPLTTVGFGVSPALEPTETQEPGELASFGSGAVEVLNVPATAGGLAQGVEFGARATQRTAAGGGEQVREDIEASGRDIAAGLTRAATERPVQTGGMLAGSLVGSAGAIRAASGVSSRAGAATRVAIQPGEEALGVGGARVTRAVAGERAAETLFPNNEPLIFSEEAAIRGARRAGRGVQETLTPPADGSVGRVGAGIVPQTEVEADVESETETREGDLAGIEAELERMQQRGQPQVTPGGRSVQAEVERVRREGGGVPSQRFDPSPQVEFTGFEFETELEPEIETAIEPTLRPEADTEQLLAQQTATVAETEQRFLTSQLALDEAGVDTGLELDQQTELGVDTETETLTETETRLDQVTESLVETETEQELETEQETAVETGFESLFETEQEIEPERDGVPTPDEQVAADFDALTGVRAVEATLAPTEFEDV